MAVGAAASGSSATRAAVKVDSWTQSRQRQNSVRSDTFVLVPVPVPVSLS